MAYQLGHQPDGSFICSATTFDHTWASFMRSEYHVNNVYQKDPDIDVIVKMVHDYDRIDYVLYRFIPQHEGVRLWMALNL